jgi:hypothetical protein
MCATGATIVPEMLVLTNMKKIRIYFKIYYITGQLGDGIYHGSKTGVI